MRALDMTTGKPGKLILSFALPMMLGNICQQLYTIVDGAFVGRFAGIDALAAVGAADWLCWIFMGVVLGYAQGFSIVISQRFGAKDEPGLKKSVYLCFVLTGGIALLLTFVSQALLTPLLHLLGTPEDIFPKAVLYLRILLSGVPIFSAYNAQAAILRAVGDSRTPLIAMLIASITNIALDALFVIVFHWGVAGAAAATILAQAVSAVFCFFAVRSLSMIRYSRKETVWDRDMARRMISLGTPTAAQNVIIGLGGLAVQRVINSFGSVFIAGFTATNKLYGLMEMAATSYGAAIASYAGQNYGAQNRERIKNGVRAGVILSIVTSAAISIVLLLAGRSVLSLFVDPAAAQKEEVLDVAQRYLNFMLFSLVILYLLYVYRSALQGMGNTLIPMLSGFAELVMRVLTALILPRLIGQDGIYYAEPAAWLGAELLLMTVYYHTIRKLDFNKEAV